MDGQLDQEHDAVGRAAEGPAGPPIGLLGVFLVVRGGLMALGALGPVESAPGPGFSIQDWALWATSVHTSRTALGIALVIWAILPASTGRDFAPARFD